MSGIDPLAMAKDPFLQVLRTSTQSALCIVAESETSRWSSGLRESRAGGS